jgi:N-acetylmuramoyl-L-alanine amidase
LSVESKEKTKYVVHELTEEDIKEIEYYDSLELLAICVEAEAGNQDLMGKRLVADVILNRVDSDDFPNTITEVIEQPYQFTSYADGNMDKVWEPSEETFKAVRMELEHRYNSDITFFTEGQYNPYCIPAFKYGSHYFGY